jgi:hypothetical protein
VNARTRVPLAHGATVRGRNNVKEDEMSDDELKAELARLKAENEALKAKEKRGTYLRVSEKGGVSLYGMRRFPITFYREEWERILGMADEVRNFISAHASELKTKGGAE